MLDYCIHLFVARKSDYESCLQELSWHPQSFPLPNVVKDKSNLCLGGKARGDIHNDHVMDTIF